MSLQSELIAPQYDGNIKELIDTVLKFGLYDKLNIKSISDNIFLKEKQTDILAITTKEEIYKLIEEGYEETEYENYTNTVINAAISFKELNEYKLMNFYNTVSISGIHIGTSFKNNIVNITQQNPYKLIKSIEYDFDIKDFFIDGSGFVYILTGDTFIKSHIVKDFYKQNYTHECITKIEDIDFLYKIKLKDIKQLLYVDDYKIHYLNNNNKVIECELGRKYYFIKDNQVFFNVIGNTDKVTVQVEHTHFYDWISLLGLNTFQFNKHKLSTKYTDSFKNILRFPFNSTLNGMLNYCDFTENKSYKIDKDIDFIKIEGNFNHDYKKGLFEIVVRADKKLDQPNVNFVIQLMHNKECIKSIKGNSVDGIAYFCNLKFIFYKSNYKGTVIRFPIEVIDDYSVKTVRRYKHIDETSLISDFSDLAKIDQFFRRDSIKHQLVETDYDNGHFIIRNYIKNSKERNFNDDLRIRFVEKDGSPSILWRQIKNKDYFLKLKNYLVIKKLKPKRTENPLMECNTVDFKLNLNDYINKNK